MMRCKGEQPMTYAIVDLEQAPLPPFAPAARRSVRVFGARVELVWLPDRAARRGRPGDGRPAFQPDIAARILATESLWRDEHLCVTPNRYPFARQQALLWPAQPIREADERFLHRLFAWNDALGGTALLNTIGAAASIPRAHAHLTPERLPFLPALGEAPATGDFVPAVAEVRFVQKQVPFCLLGVRGPAPARASAVHALALARGTASWNLVDADGTAWVYPRSAVETPAPEFPYPLGAAEVWGRWCYLEEQPFAAATGSLLERALVRAGMAAMA
jgi:hypothetical protein